MVGNASVDASVGPVMLGIVSVGASLSVVPGRDGRGDCVSIEVGVAGGGEMFVPVISIGVVMKDVVD